MANGDSTVRRKAVDLIATLLREQGGPSPPRGVGDRGDTAICDALTPEHGLERAADLAFHLTDWFEDAAFLLAVQLIPDRFTSEEIRQGVLDFLIHAPNHVAAAAHLGGWPVNDIFELGLRIDG